VFNLRNRVLVADLVGQFGIGRVAWLKLVVRSCLLPSHRLVDWWDLRLLGLGLVRLPVFLACQLVDCLLENQVDLGKDILRYLL